MVAVLLPFADASQPPLTLVGEPEPFQANADALTQRSSPEPANRASMIAQHLPLVRYVAGSMARHASACTLVDYEDLVGYGTEGLIEAVDTFNPAYNVRFSTWAVIHIRTTIQDSLRALDPLPRSLRDKSKEIERARTELANRRGGWPADRDVAEQLGIGVDRLRRLQQDINRTVVSLESAIDTGDDGPGTNWLATLSDDDPECSPQEHLDNIEMRLILRQAVAAIPERERVVLTLYYGQMQNMRMISERIGVSESRVSQLHARALKLLRSEMNRMLEVA